MSRADIVVDTSALLAFFDASEPDHRTVGDILAAASDRLIISPYVIAELDYVVATRHGVRAELAVLGELSGGAWDLAGFGVEDVAQALAIIERYRDQEIGIADASNVVLADRYGTRTILTLDVRHFSVLRAGDGGHLTVLPD